MYKCKHIFGCNYLRTNVISINSPTLGFRIPHTIAKRSTIISTAATSSAICRSFIELRQPKIGSQSEASGNTGPSAHNCLHPPGNMATYWDRDELTHVHHLQPNSDLLVQSSCLVGMPRSNHPISN